MTATELLAPADATSNVDTAASLLALASIASLSGCGSSGSTAQAGNTTPAAAPLAASTISEAEAARFLMQAAMGITRAEIAQVQNLGYAGWIAAQIKQTGNGSRWDWLVSKGFNASTFKNSQAGIDAALWRKLISSPDTLRQRFALALSEILVVAVDGLIGGGWKAFSAAAYMDMLEQNCFGNFRQLLEAVSTSCAMGEYLTYRGNVKYNAKTGAMPDENYAREIMQLFSIGLLELNLDGSLRLTNGQAQETYSLNDITGLARVWTGWGYDLSTGVDTPDFKRRPMVQTASRHETGASSFLGQTIPAGLSGEVAMQKALDIICNHANVAPFISKQLIQRLVSSNPSPAYVQRVATVFENDGKGQRGNLTAVLNAILLDAEARSAPNASAAQSGKLREPVLRFCAWARAFNLQSASNNWALGDTSDPATRLGQSPLRSPTVFNFFRPGYVPPNTAIANAHLVAPEFQLANESSVIGFVNFMQKVVSASVADLTPDYSSILSLADTPVALVAELNLLLAANQLTSANLQKISDALASMPTGTEARRKNRVYAALTLVLASPEFIVQK